MLSLLVRSCWLPLCCVCRVISSHVVQTKVVGTPITSVSASAPVPIPRFASPVSAMQTQASQESFNNMDTNSSASGDVSSSVTRPDEAVTRVGVAHSVTTDDGSVPDSSALQARAAPQEAPQTHAKPQVSALVRPAACPAMVTNTLLSCRHRLLMHSLL